tara:strand:- start:23 stop:1321 length:1299 start_codon:yes stop_codon:yes gene_type:complete
MSIAMIAIGFANMGCLIGFRRDYFKYYETNYFKDYVISLQIFIITIFIIFYIISSIFDNIIFQSFSKLDNQQNFWSLLVLTLLLDFFNKYFLTYLVNAKKSKLYLFIFGLKSSSNILITIILFHLNFEIFSIIYSLLFTNIFILIISIIYQFKFYRDFKFRFELVRQTLKISYPMTLRILFGKMNGEFDKILIANIISPAATAIYFIGQSIAYFVFLFLNALDKVFITGLNNHLFKKEKLNLSTYLTPFFFLVTLSAIVVLLFHDIVLYFLVDKKYAGSEYIILFFSIHYCLLFFAKISGTQFIFLKKAWTLNNIFIFNVFLNIILTILLALKFGIEGAALATLISGVITTFISYKIANKQLKIEYEFKKIFILLFFLLITFLISVYLVNSNYEIFDVKIIILKISIIILFIICGFFTKLINKNLILNLLRF